MSNRLWIVVVAFTVVLMSVFTAMPVAFAASSAIEEVVVTARKRAESLQDSPITVTAFSETTIERAGIESMRDYASLTPNVTLVETQASGFAFVNVRGLSQLRNTDPTVALVIDGVLSTSPLSFSQELFDIEQIEFLKGPQGALYGRNSLGGAINIRTKQPTNDFEGKVKLAAGNGNSVGALGLISGPLIEDTLLGRASISYKDADGWRDNITAGEKADPYNDLSARGKLLWMPNDIFTADFRVSVSDGEGAGIQFVSTALAGVFNGVINDSPSPIFPPGNPLYVPTADPNDTDVAIQGNLIGYDSRESVNLSLKLDWEMDFGTITSITSWDDLENALGGEQPHYTPAAELVNAQFRSTTAIAQEIRISSPGDSALRWIAGAYAVQTDFFLATSILIDDNGNPTKGTIPQRTPNRTAPNMSVSYNSDDNDNFAYALFAQFNYDISDTVELSFAGRYDEDKREQTVLTPDDYNPPITVDGEDFILPGLGTVRDETYSSFQPKVTLRYQPNENATLFATYSEGFRSGGFNPSGSEEVAAAALAAGIPGIPLGIEDTYEQEETSNIELGAKLTFLEGRLQANAAVFQTDVDNQQLFNFISVPLNKQIIRNIDEVSISGLEIDLSFAATDNLLLTAGYGMIDSEIERFDVAPTTVGNKSPLNPESSLNVGLQYSNDFTLGGTEMFGYLRVDYQYLDETWWEPENYAPRDSLELLNVRIGISTADERWAFSIWSKNATDENYFAEVTNPPSFNYYASLRKYGAEFTFRF